jgi:hypothetical protein
MNPPPASEAGSVYFIPGGVKRDEAVRKGFVKKALGSRTGLGEEDAKIGLE